MQSILKDLEMLGGVQHGCVIHQEAVKASTFPSILNDNLTGMAKVMTQIFMGVEGMQRDHRELHIELEENLMIGYWLENGAVLALLADKNINLALIKTAVRSATAKLLDALSDSVPLSVPSPMPVELASAEEQPEVQADSAPIAVAEALPADVLNVHMEKLKLLLAEQIGPAARVVFGRAQNSWQAAGEPLTDLCGRLAEFIDNEDKRAEFIRRATTSLPKG
ncbi:hypothetical protein IOQ59_20165 [Pontibacterium sp. N1Y112]|uniref:DUF8082 domain-containing protein n=1 Tax=Pontibacterium sinense TaxID=2781979 RepID=A0A8J7K0T1_9GAMM|nr:hypothetical protein [Pontibacterium sinense]MBE9399584.1 hypothetical protein [Pontibacterium sinense]